MGFNSQSGQFGMGIQTLKGTAVAATRFMPLRSGGLGGDRALLIPDPEIGGGRDVQNAYMGPVAFSGDVEFYPRMEALAMLLYGVLGAKNSTSDSGPPVVGTHVITPADTIPWFTVEERVGNQFESFQYTDTKVNSLHMEAEATGYLTGSANMIALGGVSGFTEQVSPDFDESPMMVGTNIVFEFGGADLHARSFSVDLENNIENDDFRLGSLFLYDAVAKRRMGRIGANYRPEDATLWKQAMWGGSAFTTPQGGRAYRGPATITMTTFETIGDEVAGTPFSVEFEIPACVIAPHKVTPSGDDIIGSDIELTMIRPSLSEPLVTVTVVNDLATVS